MAWLLLTILFSVPCALHTIDVPGALGAGSCRVRAAGHLQRSWRRGESKEKSGASSSTSRLCQPVLLHHPFVCVCPLKKFSTTRAGQPMPNRER
ncbi:hypothetical protein F5884DRAFT_398103 [Xylogone sp. PMI_703]|nr:hypothetical protein F5884DRAFT_398103 [Xylogone sp. PMI_703]